MQTLLEDGQPLGAMKSFLFVRHGQTEPNALGLRCGGDLDVPLTETGCSQAWEGAWRVRRSLPAPGLILCGDLQRVRQTAMIFAAVLGGLEIASDPLLNERRLGQWNRRPIEDTEEALKRGVPPPGGETEADFRLRVADAAALVTRHLDRRPLVVSSKGVGRVLHHVLGGTDRLLVGNAEVVEFRLWAAAGAAARLELVRDAAGPVQRGVI